MKNKVFISSFLFIVVTVFSIYVLVKERAIHKPVVNQPVSQESPAESQIILFYGQGCPHCASVDKYLEENDIKDRINFSHKEVYQNQTNAKELEEKAKACGIPNNSIGIPLLWDGEKCYVGDQEVINFFKQKVSPK